MNLVDMHHEPGAGEAIPCATPSDYPYGLRITLHQEQLEALGFAALPPAGTKLHLEAYAVVTRSSTEDPDADGDIDYVCVELQLTELGAEEEESAVERRAKGAKRLYGKEEGGE